MTKPGSRITVVSGLFLCTRPKPVFGFGRIEARPWRADGKKTGTDARLRSQQGDGCRFRLSSVRKKKRKNVKMITVMLGIVRMCIVGGWVGENDRYATSPRVDFVGNAAYIHLTM